MPMNRVQFQPSLSMFEYMERYGTEEKCEAAVAAMRWPEGSSAPSARRTEPGASDADGRPIASAAPAATSAA